MECSLHAYDTVSSTNDLVKQALEAEEPEGFAARAYQQTGGYGRQGRTWASPVGGMYESVLLRPQARGVVPGDIPTLSLLCSLAVRRALAGLLPEEAEEVRVKWPNDVVCEAADSFELRKLAGISLEAHAGGVCVGIGVNVFPPGGDAQVGGKNTPAYLCDLGYHSSFGHALSLGTPASSLRDDPAFRRAVEGVGQAVLDELATLYEEWVAGGIAPFLEEYRRFEVLDGSRVRLVDVAGGALAEGVCVGVDEGGNLLLRVDDGGVRPFASGEAHVA